MSAKMNHEELCGASAERQNRFLRCFPESQFQMP